MDHFGHEAFNRIVVNHLLLVSKTIHDHLVDLFCDHVTEESLVAFSHVVFELAHEPILHHGGIGGIHGMVCRDQRRCNQCSEFHT